MVRESYDVGKWWTIYTIRPDKNYEHLVNMNCFRTFDDALFRIVYRIDCYIMQ